MYSFEAMQILIFLLPGFVSETILNVLTVRKDKNDFGKVIEALVFSIITYVIYSLVYSKSPIALTVVSAAKDSSASTYTLSTEGIGLVILLGISLAIPLVVGWLITNDLHMILLRRLHITGKSARESVWLDLFLNNKRSVIVNFDDEKRITGFPQYYSDDPSSQYLYLHEPAWMVYNEDEKKDELVVINDVDGILITPQVKIETIMFIKSEGKYGTEQR